MDNNTNNIKIGQVNTAAELLDCNWPEEIETIEFGYFAIGSYGIQIHDSYREISSTFIMESFTPNKGYNMICIHTS